MLKKSLEEKSKTQADNQAEVVIVSAEVEDKDPNAPSAEVSADQDEGAESASSGTSTPLEAQSTQWVSVNDGASGW